MSAAAYYNEIDPFAAQWLRNLIAAGHIAPGEVDERSIEDVTPDDLKGFTQCHFFAGIGVWSHSLSLAGWPDDRPVWTGSCPCQPFSAAGKGDGFADERHLWPHFFHLISERRPQHVFGEQVAAGNANVWFDLVQADLEGMGYAFGLVPFTSAGIGAPHIRERAYWVANADSVASDRRGSVRAPGGMNIQTAAMMSGWPTPTTIDNNGQGLGAAANAPNRDRHWEEARMAGWVTPTSRDWKDSAGMTAQRDGKARLDQLPRRAFMTGWPTPRAVDGEKGSRTLQGCESEMQRKGRLDDLPSMAAWSMSSGPLRLTVFGEMRTGSFVEMANGVQLNPAHSRWLMGLPHAWDESSPGWQEWQAATASAA
ncbi:hypothetical protein KPZU09_01710 [Klebsiella pneumoniae]|uniref:DNA (cytosine-5-)-methyltransferase n=1 Tax=Klebsiella pneumoniae TaxID=573 RepID=A0A919HLM4_KLEPN|nr:hypothetical protein KPZU09_01710 [Klebsiella pneumoniae]